MAPDRKRQRLSEKDEDEETTVETPTTKTVGDGIEESTNSNEKRTKKQQSKQQQSRSIFVRSLPATTTTDTLTEHFSQSYPIKHATAVLDPLTKQCKGYGFVTFADAEDAQRARVEFDGSTIQGRKIKVEVAEPRHRDLETLSGADSQRRSVPSAAAVDAKAARDRKKVEAERPPKLIVRNLPWSIKTSEQLSVLFRSFGKVKHATIPTKKPGLMAGFGFVVMRGRANAEKALAAVNGKEIDGRVLAVDWAVERDVWQNVQADSSKNGEHPDTVDVEQTVLDAVDGALLAEGNDDADASLVEGESSGVGDESDGFSESEPDGASKTPQRNDNSSTLFIRNLPFSCSDEDLEDHFTQFGSVRYARIVLDHLTERPRGTGFVCFFNTLDAEACLKGAPRYQPTPASGADSKMSSAPAGAHSILQNEDSDPTGRYTMDGRILQVSRAVAKPDADRLKEEGVAHRGSKDKDKRRLYLLSEGTIASNSPLYEKLAPSEITMREASAKQRKSLVENNPSLHLSLTRLSIRNIPRSITSKDLKALAREAVVGFAVDVKAGARQRLSKEELERGGEEMKEAERQRKSKAKGIVKQAKIVFEGREGGKVDEGSGAGRSRGYGFIEYYTHRSALMGLRWLNGHAIGYKTMEKKSKKSVSKEDIQDRKKRLIVEFAIENAQVVGRRQDREVKARERSKAVDQERKQLLTGNDKAQSAKEAVKSSGSRKRKRDDSIPMRPPAVLPSTTSTTTARDPATEKLAKREKIIARKRMTRRVRKKGTTA
ncbi:hypothetical protein BJ546DRAFT_92132 [Cryomyces antarcticus]|nr:hypothetical protein LTR04_002271 [Oleoguttula sp. CCFEE 6159]